ncbi:MAG: hypothetical protein AAGD04_08225 [Pseudomonadota bacterium]
MTEMFGNFVWLGRKPKPIVHHINPTRFAVAFIGAPFLFALFTFWIMLVPVVALAFGLPFWVGITLPFLLWYLPRFGPDAGLITWCVLQGTLSGFAMCLYYYVVQMRPHDTLEDFLWGSLWWLGLCIFFSFAWSQTFRSIYCKLDQKGAKS